MQGTRRSAVAAATSAFILGLAPPAFGQATPPPQPPAAEVAQVRAELTALRQEFDALRRQYGDRLLALEQRLAELGAGPLAASAASAPATPAPADAVPQVPRTSSQVFNPDTSVITNFLGFAGKNPENDEPTLALEEAELAFQAIVDPFARADIYIAAGHEGVEIEEAFATFTTLPANLLLKAGKMRAPFGKMNLLHTHNVPGADRPLVSENLLGGHDGYSDAGVSLSRLLVNPVVFLELTGEVYAGDSPVFQSDDRSSLNYLGRVRAYRDLTEAANLDVGATFALGPTRFGGADDHGHGDEDEDAHGDEGDEAAEADTIVGGLDRRLFGVDATFRYRPLRGTGYRRLNLRSELVWSRQELPDGDRTTAFGVYGLANYQFARRWYVGGRVDRSGRQFDGDAVDTGGAVFLTFAPSEYSLLRGQYRRINYSGGITANEFLFQLNFSIGAHGAHVF